MVNTEVTFDDLMFQLFYRDFLTDSIKDAVNRETNNISKKFLSINGIRGLVEEGKWEVLANQDKLKSKQNEWKSMKRDQASSGGVVRQFLASAGSSVLEAGIRSR